MTDSSGACQPLSEPGISSSSWGQGGLYIIPFYLPPPRDDPVPESKQCPVCKGSGFFDEFERSKDKVCLACKGTKYVPFYDKLCLACQGFGAFDEHGKPTRNSRSDLQCVVCEGLGLTDLIGGYRSRTQPPPRPQPGFIQRVLNMLGL